MATNGSKGIRRELRVATIGANRRDTTQIANEFETPRFSNGAEVLILSSRSEVD